VNLSGGPGLAEVAPGASTVYGCEATLRARGTDVDEASVEGTPPVGKGFTLMHTSNQVIAHGPMPAPSVQTSSASEAAQRSVQLNGQVNPRGELVTTCRFEYGTTGLTKTASCSSLPGSGASLVAVAAPVRGLSPSTTYHYRISASSTGGTSTGTELEFKTTAAAAPTVESVGPSEVGQRTALANGAVNPKGAEVTSCRFEYGTTSLTLAVPCSKLPGSGTAVVAVSAQLAGLAPGASYRYRISATSLSGTARSVERQFETRLAAAPSVETAGASEVLPRSAVLHATVNPNGAEVTSCKFEYGTSSLTQSVSCSKLPGLGTSAVAVSAGLKGLTSATTYHFRISASSASGTSKGSEGSFES
jgi:phosphodiesterase/alkaline phosphatase D-like protein